MPCLDPKIAWVSDTIPRRMIFQYKYQGKSKPEKWHTVNIPCGKCFECRKKQSKEWAVRIVHEAEMNEENCFLTLTYNEENLPDQLEKRDLQLFLKRLRRQYEDIKIRYFACGEYGEQYSRPHYHIILFGIDLSDENKYDINEVERIWGKGFITVGNVTEASASYVAGYVQKKLNKKEEDYVDKATGLIRQKEFSLMSTGRGSNKGIGYSWIKKYHVDTYNDDTVRIGKLKAKPPRYYDKVVFTFEQETVEKAKTVRIEQGKIKKEDLGIDKIDSIRKISNAKQNLCKQRSYENA